MKISLKDFESEIDDRIVDRGEEYFSDGAVRGLKKIKDDQWAASVDGTETYQVRVNVKGDAVKDYSCSCPYDLGPVCKHVVAVLYAMREQQEEGQHQPAKKKSSSSKNSKKEPKETLEQVITRMLRKDLNALLLEYAGRDMGFTDYVFAQQSLRSPSSNKEEYQQLIQNTVDAARGRHGFIDWDGSSQAVEGAEMLLDKADKLISSEEYRKALPVYQAVVHEMVPVLQDADDSMGNIGDVIERALNGLSVCVRASVGQAHRKDVLDYLFEEFEDKRYEDWSDWKWSFLEMAAEIVEADQEQKKLLEIADKYLRKRDKGDGFWRSDEETVLKIKQTVIRRCGSPEESTDFIKKNLRYPFIRQQALEEAFKKKDYDQVKVLAEDGIALDGKGNFRGLVNDWTQWLLKAAQTTHNVVDVKKHAVALFLDSGRDDYYKCYKKCFSAQEWEQEASRIIDVIKKSSSYRNEGLLPQVYIWEERWQDLLDMVHQKSSSHMLDAYGAQLSPHFPKELVEIYVKVITNELAPLLGRKNYQNLCRFLRRMKKLDTQGRVKTLIEELSVKYANRPAMLEEMQRV